MNTFARGTLGGIAATSVMSVPMLVAGRMGWMPQQPPERIVESALDATDVEVEQEGVKDTLTVASHYAFGVGCGVLFTLLHDRLRPPGPTILHGGCFGLAVWAVSYQGWIPKLGILPAAHRDRPGRRRTMVVGHVLYGSVLGLVASGRRT